ncbi:MAG: hypothetical protein KJN72_12165 [Woeseia sp.]|nr:hypothetical protein [Woeseia sp.]
MITLGATVFDLEGFVVIPDSEIDPNSDIENGSRRVTRTATLDGGAAVVDTGFSHSDRQLLVTLPNPTRSLFDAIAHLCQLYPEITVTTIEGAFVAVIEDYRAANSRVELTLLLIRTA